MKKGPGNPAKVASNMSSKSTSKLKNVFTNVSNKIKAEQAKKDQLNKYKESLRQKKLAEQKAQKDLQLKERGGRRGKMSVSKEIKVTGKQKPTYGESKRLHFSEGKDGKKSTYYASAKSIPTDSAKFMQNLAAVNPAAYRSAMKFMTTQQAKNPGARFKFGGSNIQATGSDIYAKRPGETPKLAPNQTNKNFPGLKYLYSVPQITTVLPNKKKKK